jgi:SAM-dependent methyltransferase
MKIQRIRHRLRKSLAQRGAIGTAAAALKKGLRHTPKSAELPKQYRQVHPFDEQFGLDTSGLVHPEDLSSGTRQDLYNNGYFGVAPSAFRKILAKLELQFEKYAFVDLGSGKWRALLLASEYPFREVIGVELSPELHSIAVANIRRFQSPSQVCGNVRSIEGDAAGFAFPPGPLVVYLWNPFEAIVLARVLANLKTSLSQEPREIYLLYIQPDFDDLLKSSGCLHKLWHEEFEMSEEDYAAHAFPPRVEICSAYRSVV